MGRDAAATNQRGRSGRKRMRHRVILILMVVMALLSQGGHGEGVKQRLREVRELVSERGQVGRGNRLRL